MKKLVLAILASLVLLLCSAPAFAGNEIVLGSSTGAPIKFVGTGHPGTHDFNVTFNITISLRPALEPWRVAGFIASLTREPFSPATAVAVAAVSCSARRRR